MRRIFLALLLLILAVTGVSSVPVVAAVPDRALEVVTPGRVTRDRAFAITLRLPDGTAALDGRAFFDRDALELIGVAPSGGGVGLRPVDTRGGAAFGAYGLRSSGGATVVRLVFVAHRAGRVQVRVAVDAVASGDGRRLSVLGADRQTTVGVDGGSKLLTAPDATASPQPEGAAGPLVELQPDGRIDKSDVDVARWAWERARLTGDSCAGRVREDANGDGCVDIVDLQATLAARGTRTSIAAPSRAAAIASATFVVNSQSDTPDVAKGNGVCADSAGACTLRAAIMEANNRSGDDRIEFAIPVPAPARIQLTGPLPIISSRAGNIVIDGYTQPGSRVNTATVGSNAIPGVEIRGNGAAARESALFITSSRNTIRGLLIHNVWRAIVLDHADAYANRVLGNLIGFLPNGANDAFQEFAVVINTGAHDNVVGTPALADRNVIGNYQHAVELFGPGTNANIVQGNMFCITPSGLQPALCYTGVDHNFGPKNGLIGGTGLNERNVIGATALQGVEYSHGWNPAVGNNDPDPTWQVNNNRSIGNWVGFRGDGSYDIAFRSGQYDQGGGDNGNGFNCYDGSNDNLIQGNYVASRFDGIQILQPNAQRNTVRNNIVGQSPLGQAAPLTGWGIKIRSGTRFDTIEGNTIRNAALGGIGLTQRNVLNIRISRNIVTDTNGPAIDLYGIPGPDPNDAGDADSGANTLLNTPVFTTATRIAIAGTAVPGGTVEVFRASRPAGQFGLPVEFLGAANVAPNGTWSLPVVLTAGTIVTALQIRADGDTSELAANVAVAEAPAPPGPGDVLVRDDFERAVTGSWGTADQGGSWSHSGPSTSFSVSGGAGRMQANDGGTRESLINVDVAPVSITGRVALDRLPAAGNVWVYLVARADGGTRYNAQLRITPTGSLFARLRRVQNGAVTLLGPEVAVAGVTAAAGRPLGLRFEAVGADLRFRVWDPAGPEPSGWNVTAADGTADLQDPGAAGLRLYLSGVPNGPVSVSLDGFEVRYG